MQVGENQVYVTFAYQGLEAERRMSLEESKPTSQYVVALRGPSATILSADDPLQVTMGTAAGPARFTLQTRFVSIGFADSAPKGLWMDARGPAETIDAAVNEFANITSFLCSFLAVATNAWVGDLSPELAYNATSGLTRREYFQQSLPEVHGRLQPARRGVSGLAVALLKAVSAHPDSERLSRAVVHYAMALRHWRFGHEVLAVAHLWMGMEALTPLVRHQTCRLLNIPESDWQDSWRAAVEADESLKDQRIRRDLLFQGDKATHDMANEAMNGYEHGFMGFSSVRAQALAARDQAAAYLRTAILVLSQAPKDTADALATPPLDQPFDAIPLSKYVRGVLVSQSDDLASPNQTYPILHWRSKLVSFSKSSEGQYNASYKEKFVAELGPGVSFEGSSFEIRGPKAASTGSGATFDFRVDHDVTAVPMTMRDHIGDMLSVYRGANISPSFTSEKLRSGRFEDHVDVFEDQVRGWWLAKAYALDPDDDNSAYVVLPIALAVLIGVERLRQGKPYKTNRALFRDAFLRLFKDLQSVGFTERERKRVPNSVFDWVDGGVTPRESILVNERGPMPLRVVGTTTDAGTIELIEINPKRFLASIVGDFNAYLRELRDRSNPNSAELRSRFKATQDVLQGAVPIDSSTRVRQMFADILGKAQARVLDR